jgi:hypothetical protein
MDLTGLALCLPSTSSSPATSADRCIADGNVILSPPPDCAITGVGDELGLSWIVMISLIKCAVADNDGADVFRLAFKSDIGGSGYSLRDLIDASMSVAE